MLIADPGPVTPTRPRVDSARKEHLMRLVEPQ
jgi:hypothetical protein